MDRRYTRNIGTITAAEQKTLADRSACVVGCGGLGGGIIEGLTRMGIGRLTVIDCDVFDESNLNRQVLSNEDNIGHAKAVEARLQMKVINSEIRVDSIQAMLGEDNGRDLIYGHDIVIDALDNVEARLALEDACEAENIPLVHGAIEGWCGQVAVVMPGDRLLHMIYADYISEDAGYEQETVCSTADYPERGDGNIAGAAGNAERSTEEAECSIRDLARSGENEVCGDTAACEKITNPFFTPAVVSAIEVGEAIKVLLGREEMLTNSMLSINLLNHEYEIIEF